MAVYRITWQRRSPLRRAWIGTKTPPLVASVKQVSEVGFAQSLRSSKVVSTGQTICADNAQSVIVRKIKSVGQVSEINSSNAISGKKKLTVAQASQGGTANVVVSKHTQPVQQSLTNEIATAVSLSKGAQLGQASETTAVHKIEWAPKKRVVDQVIEADLALAISPYQDHDLIQVIEVSSALPISWNPQNRFVGRPGEISTAQLVAKIKLRSISLTSSAEIANSIKPLRSRSIDRSFESNTTKSLTIRKIGRLERAISSEAVSSIAPAHIVRVRRAKEVTTPNPIKAKQHWTLASGLASENNGLFSIRPIKVAPVGRATEVDRPGSFIRIVNKIREIDIAQPIQAQRKYVLGRVTEFNSGFSVLGEKRPSLRTSGLITLNMAKVSILEDDDLWLNRTSNSSSLSLQYRTRIDLDFSDQIVIPGVQVDPPLTISIENEDIVLS